MRRLRQYGVTDDRIFITGFTLPRENVGGLRMDTLRTDLLARLGRLDPQARFTNVFGTTVRELLGRDIGYIYPVGRLDYDSEGLLLLTTDGDLAEALTHPRHEVERVYEAIVAGSPDEEALGKLRPAFAGP